MQQFQMVIFFRELFKINDLYSWKLYENNQPILDMDDYM
jgi:hypothetical protein